MLFPFMTFYGYLKAPASLHLLAFPAQAKPVRLESAGASALFNFNPDDKTETQGIIGVSSVEVC